MRRLIFTLIMLIGSINVALSNYEENSSCINGEVVYEGQRDYFIIYARGNYTIAERVYGYSLYEGDKVRGELKRSGYGYLLRLNSNSEVRVYIVDWGLSEESAIRWMGEHEKLKDEHQKAFDRRKDY